MKKFIKHTWRTLVGMGAFALYLILGYIGQHMEYFNAFILQCMIATTAIGFCIYLWNRKATNTITDGDFYYPTKVELLDASRYAHEAMSKTGWNYPANYVWRWKDCEDYAERMSTLMKEWFYENVPAQRKKGLPIAPYGYTTDKGKGHVNVECAVSDKKSIWFEVYPGYGEPMKLSKKEQKSADRRNFR